MGSSAPNSSALLQAPGRKVWCSARSGSTGFRRRFGRQALVQGHVKFNRVPEKVAETKRGQVHLTHGNPAEVFPALGFPAHFRSIVVKIQRCGCWGYHRILFFGELKQVKMQDYTKLINEPYCHTSCKSKMNANHTVRLQKKQPGFAPQQHGGYQIQRENVLG